MNNIALLIIYYPVLICLIDGVVKAYKLPGDAHKGTIAGISTLINMVTTVDIVNPTEK